MEVQEEEAVHADETSLPGTACARDAMVRPAMLCSFLLWVNQSCKGPVRSLQ
jgi:hypothetical protein